MSFEVFSGFDSPEQSGDVEAYERLQEKMRENRRHIQALQKREKKQKQQEEKLIQILLRFIRSKKHADLVALIARLLEENIPASFIVSIILLGQEDIQKEIGISLKVQSEREELATAEKTIEPRKTTNAPSYISGSLPYAVRLEIELWGRNMFEAARGYATRMLAKGCLPTGEPKSIIIDTATYVLDEYLCAHNIPEDFFHLRDFLKGIFAGLFAELKSDQKKELLEG